MIQFFLYEIQTGIIFLLLPSLPENSDFFNTGKIYHDGKKVASGINFDLVGYEICEPIDIDQIAYKYVFDSVTEEISLNANYDEEDVEN